MLFTENLSLTLRAWESWLNIKLEAIDLLIVEVIDSSLSALWTVVAVVSVVEADESEWLRCAILINFLHYCDRLDVTELREELFKILLLPQGVVVLHINVVEDLGCIVALFLLENL